MTIRGAIAVAPELDRVAEEVLPHHGQQGRVAVDGGKWLVGTHDVGVGVLDGGGQVVECSGQHCVEVDLGARGSKPPDPGEREQVVDQRLHPLGAVDREPDVFGASLVELVAVSLLQQLAERRDLAQRLLQIVRCDIRELLEFGVGPPQLLGLLGRTRSGRSGWPRVRRRSVAACPRRRSRSPG